MCNWKKIKLDNYLEATSSKRIFAKEYVDDGIPFYRSKEIIEKEFGKKITNPLRISYARFNEIKNKYGAPVDGDILISAVGERSGIPYVVSNDGEFYFKDGNLIWLKNFNKNLHSIFLYYWLKSTKGQYVLFNSMIGSAQRALTIQGIKNLTLNIPPLKEQKAIAEVLSSLDDKIDLLRRQNKTLENLAQTLFRQHFIEEANDEWEEKPLKYFCKKITKGTTPTILKKSFVDCGINFIKVNCIDDDGNYIIDKFNFIDDDTNTLLKRSQLEGNDILYSIAGTIGRIAIVNKDILPANVNQALAIIRVDIEKINPHYIKYCLKDKNITSTLHSKIVHAVQPNLSLSEISNTFIPLPNKETLNKFSSSINPLEDKTKYNKIQIKTLENLRDTLLPKLMSGEVRIKL